MYKYQYKCQKHINNISIITRINKTWSINLSWSPHIVNVWIRRDATFNQQSMFKVGVEVYQVLTNKKGVRICVRLFVRTSRRLRMQLNIYACIFPCYQCRRLQLRAFVGKFMINRCNILCTLKATRRNFIEASRGVDAFSYEREKREYHNFHSSSWIAGLRSSMMHSKEKALLPAKVALCTSPKQLQTTGEGWPNYTRW